MVASFFFFQAEDGIRDLYVTGVQTCALPISATAAGDDEPVGEALGTRTHVARATTTAATGEVGIAGSARVTASVEPAGTSGRSEERRVGKEWRTRRYAARRSKAEKRVATVKP